MIALIGLLYSCLGIIIIRHQAFPCFEIGTADNPVVFDATQPSKRRPARRGGREPEAPARDSPPEAAADGFALWATACETALWPAGTFYSANRNEAVEGVIDADPIAAAVRSFMAMRKEWTGTASDLLDAFAELVGEGARLTLKTAGNGCPIFALDAA
jgi:hypothetical protein